mgnify:CR=1 FL=1
MNRMGKAAETVDSNESNGEVDDVDESEIAARSITPISYFGTEFDVHGLVRRFNQESVVVPSFDPQAALPDSNLQGFQRSVVWTKSQKDRFVESLMLGFPVPGIFLVEQPQKRYIVLDGQQRLTTLASFYSDGFALTNVEESLKGLKYSTLTDEQQRALDDTFIQAVIIRMPKDVDEYESVYQIFERLNSGGTKLQPHEIRVALYSGKTVETIRLINENEDWRGLFGKRNPRLKDQELILRVVALHCDGNNYAAPMKGFLNDFLGRHRDGEGLDLNELARLFTDAARVLFSALGTRAFRLGRQVNAAILESVFVGVMSRLTAPGWKDIPPEAWDAAYGNLLEDSAYLEAVTQATANETPVSRRLELSREQFGRL